MTERPPGRLEGADELRVTPPFDAEGETRVAPDEREAEDPPAAPAAPAAPALPAPPPASAAPAEHAPGRLVIPDGVGAFVGMPNGVRRSVGIVVSRYNGDITTKLLEGALGALTAAGVQRDRIDVLQVPGAFELPLGAMALAKSRRYACVVALGCVIRGETPHFDYIAAEAASGLQLAALETGVPVVLGVLTTEDRAQAEARAGGAHGNKGEEAASSALEMADVFARLRAVTTAPGPSAA